MRSKDEANEREEGRRESDNQVLPGLMRDAHICSEMSMISACIHSSVCAMTGGIRRSKGCGGKTGMPFRMREGQ